VEAPINETVEVAGPEQFRLDELLRRSLAAIDDPRSIISDAHARYFGGELSERMAGGSSPGIGAASL